MIIGDDTSARIPTLIIVKVLNAWYKSQNLEPADVRFAYGKPGQAETDVASVFEHIKAVPAKVLLATEHIESGEHIAYLAGALDRRGVNFDIASLYILRSEEYYRRDCLTYLGKISHFILVSLTWHRAFMATKA